MRLGDLVERITYYTGIKWIVEKSTKLLGYKDCGCKERQETWNDVELW